MSIILPEYVGSTLRAAIVCSGATIDPISSSLYDRSEALVNSAAGVSSGNGFYYADHALPNSGCYLVQKWSGVIDSNTYVRMAIVHVRAVEV